MRIERWCSSGLGLLVSLSVALSFSLQGFAEEASQRGAVLPMRSLEPAGPVGIRVDEVPRHTFPEREAPEGAPNVVIVLLDDVGFAATSTFGGLVPTPELDRLAKGGLRYNRFHTTAICSPPT